MSYLRFQKSSTSVKDPYLQTSFEHEVYTDGWLKNLSTTLDYIPIVGGVKNAIEGLCGYTMTGEKLTTQERISYTALGILTTAVDVFTLGTASGLIQGGKFVGKELAKSGIKKLGKYAIIPFLTVKRENH